MSVAIGQKLLEKKTDVEMIGLAFDYIKRTVSEWFKEFLDRNLSPNWGSLNGKWKVSPIGIQIWPKQPGPWSGWDKRRKNLLLLWWRSFRHLLMLRIPTGPEKVIPLCSHSWPNISQTRCTLFWWENILPGILKWLWTMHSHRWGKVKLYL